MTSPPSNQNSKGWTPKALADRWCCTHEHVLGLIRSGALRAINISQPGAQRARYVIPPEVLEEFEAERTVGGHPQPAARRRKKRRDVVIDFFPI
jgi:hypothetical protein